MAIPLTELNWTPSYRIIGTRYPAVNFFESITADPTDWEILAEIEKMTDPTFSVGDLSLLEEEDRIAGAGAGRVLPSFTFLDPNPPGGRFNNYKFGSYYAGLDLETAIAETVHHRTRFMLSTAEPAQDLDQLVILADIRGKFHDIRKMQTTLDTIYSVTDYTKSQAFAYDLRDQKSLGIVYDSVRKKSGECVAVLRARVISNPHDHRNLTYKWDGKRICGYYDKGNFQSL